MTSQKVDTIYSTVRKLYIGTGKTTFPNYMLEGRHEKRLIAVIMNGFAEQN